jgi:hypothetical protein
MSELLNRCEGQKTARRQLLATASTIALLGVVYSAGQAHADDSARPLVWVELDGQFAQQENDSDPYIPPFLPLSPFDARSHGALEKGPPTIWDEGAKLSFQPDGSDWILSLGVRYGKINRSERRDQHPATANMTKYSTKHNRYNAYQNFTPQSSESHTILDFQAGKDFGLGMFGRGGSSVINFGVRFAQFNSRSHVAIASQPTNVSAYYPYNKFHASFAAKRKFSGLGPSISWDASADLLGNLSAGSITFDWGMNGAVLFGRQQMTAHHQVTETTYNYFARQPIYQHSTSTARNKQVAVPNLGGFAGVSWRYSNAKISAGYRADMFFGAIDGGIDTTHRENRSFNGPFASISIGIGDSQ